MLPMHLYSADLNVGGVGEATTASSRAFHITTTLRLNDLFWPQLTSTYELTSRNDHENLDHYSFLTRQLSKKQSPCSIFHVLYQICTKQLSSNRIQI